VRPRRSNLPPHLRKQHRPKNPKQQPRRRLLQRQQSRRQRRRPPGRRLNLLPHLRKQHRPKNPKQRPRRRLLQRRQSLRYLQQFSPRRQRPSQRPLKTWWRHQDRLRTQRSNRLRVSQRGQQSQARCPVRRRCTWCRNKGQRSELTDWIQGAHNLGSYFVAQDGARCENET